MNPGIESRVSTSAATPIGFVAAVVTGSSPVRLRLGLLRLDGGTQPREAIDEQVVQEYRASMVAGAIVPSVTAYFDASNHWLSDGHHRVRAAAAAGHEDIFVDLRSGTREDAAWFACAANQTHGLRRTNADKRKAVAKATELRPGESDRLIGHHCGVDHKTVAALRAKVTGEIPHSGRRTGKDGRGQVPASEKRSAAGKARVASRTAVAVVSAPAACPLQQPRIGSVVAARQRKRPADRSSLAAGARAAVPAGATIPAAPRQPLSHLERLQSVAAATAVLRR